MSEFTNLSGRLPTILKTLAVGIPAGFLFDRLHAPIPWMIGPMIAVAAFNLMGVRMYPVPWPPNGSGHPWFGGVALFHADRRGGVGRPLTCDRGGDRFGFLGAVSAR